MRAEHEGADGVAAGGHHYPTPTLLGAGVDGTLDGGCAQPRGVAHGTIVGDEVVAGMQGGKLQGQQ